MEQNSIDIIVTNENLINAVQNEPSVWDTKLNSSEEEKELAWTRIGVLVSVCHNPVPIGAQVR